MALRQDGFGDALSLCKGCGSCSLCSQVGASSWDQSMAEEEDGVMAVSTVRGHSAVRSPKDHSGSCLYSLPSASLPPHLQLLYALAEAPGPIPQEKGPFLLFTSQTQSLTSHLMPPTPFWKQCTAGVQPHCNFPQGALSCCTLLA